MNKFEDLENPASIKELNGVGTPTGHSLLYVSKKLEL